MADQDPIRVSHPETGGVFETTRKQYEEVWQGKGWQEVPGDTPLTDQRYQEEGGGESQPPPLTEAQQNTEVQVTPAAVPRPAQPAPTE